MAKLLAYSEKNTWIHRLCGVTKLTYFLLWSAVGMITYDTRILAGMLITSVVLFAVSKTQWSQISLVIKVIFLFLSINVVAIFFFSPYQGTEIYGTRTDILPLFGHYTLTWEQLFYELNIVMKYFTLIPVALLFILTTNPSEFASSLNKIGVKYSIGYAIAIALRYIPDVQKNFREIKNAQEARGLDMSKGAKLGSRIKNMASIIFPLVFSSLERIDTISNAMELRGFGKKKKRTWYSDRKFQTLDYVIVIFLVLFAVFGMVFTFYDGNRFYNPFG